MTRTFYEAYGALARDGHDPVLMAGRYRSQRLAERQIVPDLLSKLAIKPTDDLLEIGCGSGSLIIPLSFLVNSAVGMDHPDMLGKAAQRGSNAGLAWMAGPFPQSRPDRLFDIVLAYSVIHCLSNFDVIKEFITAAASLVAPGGRLMIGDIPNKDRKLRFQSSEFGAQFQQEWQKAMAASQTNALDAKVFDVFSGNNAIGTLDDGLILQLIAHLRQLGFNAYVLGQDPRLPFGHTREDILAMRL